MKLYKTFLIIFGIAILPLIVNAETPEENAKRAKEILEQARKNVTGEGDIKSFTATYLDKHKNKWLKCKLYSCFNPDGTKFLYKKDCTFDRGKKKKEEYIDFLINDMGEWYIVNKFAIKLGYNVKYTYNIIPQELSKDNEYSIKTIENELDSYLITEKIKSDNDIAFIRYCVRKKDLFPYSMGKYNKVGKLVERQIYEDIKINISIEEGIFKVSDTKEIKIAKNLC